MKTKTSLWLSICTIVLCIGVMTFGVYSAISANLNIGGTLGFNMHDCMITVSGTIQNVAKTTDNWVTAEPYTKTIERTIMGGESTTTTNFNLDPLYFYNDQDLIFSITFTNIHTKAVDATFPIPTADGIVVTVLTGTANGYTNFTDENSTYKVSISVGSSATVKFALHLANPDAMATELTSFSWTNITFEEAYQLIHYDSINNYYYIELGTVPTGVGLKDEGKPVRWIAFAESTDAKEVENKTFSIFSKTEEPKSGNTYYFMSEYVLSTVGGGTGQTNHGLSYCNDYYNTSATNYQHNTYTAVSAHNYATSNIRAYLKSTSANPVARYYKSDTTDRNKRIPDDSVKINFLDVYGITSDYLYQNKDKYITARSLKSLYETDKKSVDYSTFETTYKTTYSSLFDADYFWIPSLAELTYINGVEGTTVAYGTTYSNLIAYANYGEGTAAVTWWLRSPYSSNGRGSCSVSSGGSVNNNLVSNRFSARPAFQIQIP